MIINKNQFCSVLLPYICALNEITPISKISDKLPQNDAAGLSCGIKPAWAYNGGRGRYRHGRPDWHHSAGGRGIIQ